MQSFISRSLCEQLCCKKIAFLLSLFLSSSHAKTKNMQKLQLHGTHTYACSFLVDCSKYLAIAGLCMHSVLCTPLHGYHPHEALDRWDVKSLKKLRRDFCFRC